MRVIKQGEVTLVKPGFYPVDPTLRGNCPQLKAQYVLFSRFIASVKVNGSLQTQQIGRQPKPRDAPYTDRRNHGFVPERFARMDVG